MTTLREAAGLAALSSLEVYAREAHGLFAARHHREWVSALEDRARRRLLIIAPPGHGKSTWVAVMYPAWRLARDPCEHILLVSVTDTQAEDRADAVAQTALSPRYRSLFPHVRKGRRWTRGDWDLERPRHDDKDATMFACGVGSSALIGRRADCIIIDDPMSEETARSASMRAHLASWCRRTLLTRATPEAKIVCIMTRWHQDDLAPVLLQAGFDLIHMPAEGAGGALWPERFPMDHLEHVRRDMGSALYNCMYMGDPSGLEGRLFRREWFSVVDNVPELTHVVSGWDLATSERTEADYTVKTTLGRGVDGRVYVLDVWRERREFPAVRREVRRQGECEKVKAVGVESTAFQLAAVQVLRKDGLSFPLLAIPADKDKVSRALEWIAAAEAGDIALARGAWNDAWLCEVCGFPDATNDDQVDSFGVAWRTLRRFSHARPKIATGGGLLTAAGMDW